MKRGLAIALAFAFPLTSGTAFAPAAIAESSPGFAEGLDAWERLDFGEAKRIWRDLAEEGDARARFALGTLHARGQGTPRNRERARELWLEAAEQGHEGARHNLALTYLGDATRRTDGAPERAVDLLEKAVRNGHAPSALALGRLLISGIGIPMDRVRGARLVANAAANDLVEAHYTLGRLRRDGIGLPLDDAAAARSFRAAAEAGHGRAMLALARMLARGEGVERDRGEALKLARSAREAHTTGAAGLVAALETPAVSTAAGMGPYFQAGTGRPPASAP